MKAALRGLILVGVAALIIPSTQALAAPSHKSTAKITTVHSCSQTVGKGRFTCFALRRTDLGFKTKAQVAASPQDDPAGYGPANLQSAYALPSATAGTGKRIYIVDAYDDPTAETDLAQYRSTYGLAPCTTANGCFKKLNQSGAMGPYPVTNTGWDGEISLDLDMASAICPKCGITLIETNDNSNNLYLGIKEANALGAKYVSLSWGGSESGSEASSDNTYFKSTGTVYTAATGDDAYQAGVIYPSTSPRVVGVGGTALNLSGNARGWTESVWKNSTTQGTGSGCSSDEAKPSYQATVANSTCPKRAVSDVSAVADPNTGVAVYQTTGGSGWAVYGGTSAATPIIASVYALAGTPSSTERPPAVPYLNHTGLNDVTAGNNGTCSPSLRCTAATGWDGPTGLGTPNGVAAFQVPTGNTVLVTNPGNRSGKVGTAVAATTIHATDSAGAALTFTATGLPPGLTISAGGTISGTPTKAGAYSITVAASDSTGASNTATFSWPIAAATTGGGCSGQLLQNTGFESGSTNWTASTGVILTDGEHPRTGLGYAWLDGYGTVHTDTISQTVTVPAGCKATLSYYLYVATEETSTAANDKLVVTANGTALQTTSNLSAGTDYVKRSVGLSAYAGQTVTITWTGSENASAATSFFVDDTALTLG